MGKIRKSTQKKFIARDEQMIIRSDALSRRLNKTGRTTNFKLAR